MLQNERFGTDLKRYLPYVKIIDQSKTSDQYFRLFDVPDKLYVGKNSFRIRINKDTLVKGSLIYIDVVDSTGQIIFHEIADFVGEDGSRLVIVHVYENTPPGEATIYIGGRASYDVKNKKQLPYSNDQSSSDYIDFPNIIWTGKVITIPTNENENEIIFAKPPIIKVKERFEQYKKYTPGENRKVSFSGSFNVTINPVTTAYEYSDSSKSGNKLSENSLNVILDPGVTNNTAESRQKSIPQYSELSTLHDANGNFTEDFKGGEIIIRNLTEQLEVNDVNVSDFSCSIIEVVDSKNVKISPEFKFFYGEKNQNILKAIKNATNVTASYYTTKTDLITFDSESFIQLDFENLEPIAGKVDSIAISYKPFGSFGEFTPIGEFKIPQQEYLIDSSSLVVNKTELIERPLGKPSGSSEFATYWEVIPGKYAAGGYSSGSFLNQGIYFKTDNTVISEMPYDYKLKLRDAYGIKTVPNTEFKISFTINLEEKRSADVDFQLDVFISGSSILRDTITDKKTITLIDDLSEGERVSSVTKQTTGAVDTYTYYFKTISGGTIYPVFVIKNALVLSMKNISIQPRNEFGYSPNQAKLFVPLETLKKNTELVLNIDYLTKKKDRSKISSQVYGLFFSGSGLTSAVVDDGLGGSGVFTNVSQSIVSASVQTSGSTLYSFNPLTTNFNLQGSICLGQFAGYNTITPAGDDSGFSIYLGPLAGYNATGSHGSIFLGTQAGHSATSSAASIFIGEQAGSYATNANQSIFIGRAAGAGAKDAQKSILIGKNAGRATNLNQSIGYHNTVIGNGISLPIASTYGINIGGLIFGSNQYSNAATWGFSGSANGKIGINQPNPQYSLDVSGSGNYTNNLYLTGGLLATQSYISTLDYIDFNETSDPAFLTGRLHWIDDTKTLNINTDVNGVSIEVGHQQIVRVNNQNSFTLTKGIVVYINGESGNRPTVATASFENDALSAATLGFVAENINNNQNGYVITRGMLRGINTTAYSPGTMLYLSSSGQFSSTIPQSPLHEVRLGKTITQAVNGTIFVDVMNGYEIGELHDVLINERQHGDLISWDSGSRVWKNTKILSGSYGVSGSLVVSQGITGSLHGTASYQTVKISGSTYVTPDAGTGNFSTTNALFLGNYAGNGATAASTAVFLGYAAGENATNAAGSNFIGSNAGQGATSANGSNFIGSNAGLNATNAVSSVFIGGSAGNAASAANLAVFLGSLAGSQAINATNAIAIGNRSGLNATSASYSILLGYNAGRTSASTNSIGRNNIIIGTGISLPSGSRDAINIGGLIFGSGSNYGIALTSGNVSGSNGCIGINQPNPQKTLDVSGSTRIATLRSSLTPPTTSGTTKMVITDSNGDLSFDNIPTSFPYTGSAIISGSLQITGSFNITGSFKVSAGPVSMPIKYITTDGYYVEDGDYTLILDNVSIVNIYLPVASSYPGRILNFKNKVSSGVKVSVYPFSGDSIDNQADATLVTANQSGIIVQSDGIDYWHILSEKV